MDSRVSQYSITSMFALARFALTPQSPSSMNQTIIVGAFLDIVIGAMEFSRVVRWRRKESVTR